MRFTIRTLGRSLKLQDQRRHITTVFEKTADTLPKQIGGVHFQDGDRVIVRHKEGNKVRHRLIEPLKRDATTRTGKRSYAIHHNDIIGQPGTRVYVQGQGPQDKFMRFTATHPSLDEFVALAPRTVTPIYSSYGGTIVTLLDIHVAPPVLSNDPQTSTIPRFEILEAGTGNGGLTLHLAREIAAANPPPPEFEENCSEATLAEGWDQWRSTRRGIVHTVEFHASRSRAAERLIKSYRGALYWPHIDFHSGDVSAWVETEHSRRRESGQATEGFLDIIILDLPDVHSQLQHVIDAMKEDAQLLIWVPQITQVAACQQQVEHLSLPLKLRQVVELGEGVSTGRRWDLRFVKTRAEQKKELESGETQQAEESFVGEDTVESGGSGNKSNAHDINANDVVPIIENDSVRPSITFPTMVCRPMVGEMTMGGGFVGLWRKTSKTKSDESTPQKPEQEGSVL